MEQRIENIEKNVEILTQDVGVLKVQFKHQETLLESVAACVLRLETGQTRIEGMMQRFYFRDLEES